MGPQDGEQNIYGQLTFGLNHTSYVLLPDTKVAVTCRFRDMFSIYGTLDLYRTVQTLASNLGISEHYALNSAPGPHGWTESTETASVDWMRAWLMGDKAKLPLDCQKYRELDIGFDVKSVELGLSEKERGVTPTGRTMDLPGARDIHTILRDRFAAVRKARKTYSSAQIGEVARKLAGVRLPTETGFTVKEVSSQEIDGGAKLTRVAFTYPDGLYLPAVYVTPAKVDAAKAPILMVGAKGRAAWADQVAAAVASGAPVLVADITGFGEIGKPNKIFYGADDCPEEGISVMLYLMGESMVGRRATDMLVLASWLKDKAGAAPELMAQGTAVVPAAHAKAVVPAAFTKVSLFDAPPSWTEFIEKGDTMKFRYTSTVVNGLMHYDWPDLLK
jgi:hypothetical protein